MNTEALFSLVQSCADAHAPVFAPLGRALPGRNGPYGSPDNPVRNTGHWLIIYAFLWKRTGQESYKALAQRMARYLMAMQESSPSGAIPCMEDGAADRLNGLIGQAWAIEALTYAWRAFENEAYLQCAFRIFRAQRFDESTGLWRRVDVDGTPLSYDFTLNHQVWFCLAGLMLLQCRRDADIQHQVDRHLNRLEKEFFGAHRSGLIRHFGAMKRPRRAFLGLYARQYVKYAGLKTGLFSSRRHDILIQEEGYHLFELYGYAVMASLGRDIPLFRTAKFQKALRYGLGDASALNRRLGADAPESMNPYAYGYNAPGFEAPLIARAFGGAKEEAEAMKLLDTQLRLTFDPEAHAFRRHTADPETLSARLYECVRFLEWDRA
ncbi:MAG: hypothetical protein IJ662_01855 [Clostridia bacterium]|nr:hypothetical protein [Clostridia bacterium]